MIDKETLDDLYFRQKLSMFAISKKLKCSVNKVSYWMKHYDLKLRSISESIYAMHNPKGDPFAFRLPINEKESFLYGLGLGLYWGGKEPRQISILFDWEIQIQK